MQNESTSGSHQGNISSTPNSIFWVLRWTGKILGRVMAFQAITEEMATLSHDTGTHPSKSRLFCSTSDFVFLTQLWLLVCNIYSFIHTFIYPLILYILLLKFSKMCKSDIFSLILGIFENVELPWKALKIFSRLYFSCQGLEMCQQPEINLVVFS